MKKTTVTVLKNNLKNITKKFPLYFSPVSAGFPSPAEDYVEENINLHEYLVKNPPATFFVKVDGDSMTGAGIFSGDILVVDRSLKPASNKIVIAVIDGELTVKRLKQEKRGFVLHAENPDYPDIFISKDDDMTIWGVVTNVIHKL